jgi:Tat protein secretion system quality control protein TatD with DNase activity
MKQFKLWNYVQTMVKFSGQYFRYLYLNLLENLYTTCGYHPTRCTELTESNENEIINQMIDLCRKNSKKIVAIGEFGLDYERTQFCDIEKQKR